MSTSAAKVRSLIQLNRWDEARSEVDTALRSDPADTSLLYLKAFVLNHFKKYRQAREVAERGLAIDPGNDALLIVLGRAYYHEGRVAEAIEILQRAVALAPEDPDNHKELSELLRHGGMKQRGSTQQQMLAAADHHADQAIQLAPDEARYRFQKGAVALSRGDRTTAFNSTQAGLQIEPDSAEGLRLMGRVHEQAGDVRSASDHFVRAGKASPADDTSTQMLRRLKKAAPVSVIVLVLVLRGGLRLASHSGNAALAVIAIVIAIVGTAWYVLWPRLSARHEMTDEARRVLAQDKQTRRRRR